MRLSFITHLLSITILYGYPVPATAQDNCDDLKAPQISSEKQICCVAQPVILKATGCDGTVVWSTQKTGTTLTVYPTQTHTYTAFCQKGDCKSQVSNAITVTVSTPPTPVVEATKTKICFGDSVSLTTKGCNGEVIWSNGMLGDKITVRPVTTSKYTATCRTEGCVSCFADDIIIVMTGGEPLLVKASRPVVCGGESSVLSATGNCAGQIKWSTSETGRTITVEPRHTTDYWAMCETEGCEPVKSFLSVQVSPPTAPILRVSKNTICPGESIMLFAEGCTGKVKWSNEMEGQAITVSPKETTVFSAICQQGSCLSPNALPVKISVIGSLPAKPQVISELKNACPYSTVDLSSAVLTKAGLGTYHEAHMGDSPDSPLVENVGAITENRTYYLFARDKNGCYSEAAPVKATLQACENALPFCSTNPATATIIKADITPSGHFSLEGKTGGAASLGQWQTNGTGTFNDSVGFFVNYTPSLEDRRAGNVSIYFFSNDPDGNGPCKAGTDMKVLKIMPDKIYQKEKIGVNKWVKNQSQITAQLFEVEYIVQVVNMGQHDLKNIRMMDSLDIVFKNGAIIVGKPDVSVIDPNSNATMDWGIDTNYTGKKGHYDLLIPQTCSLAAGKARALSIKIKIDLSNAQDSAFYNTVFASATDINENECSDWSVDGNWPDMNQNEDPSDDTSPTLLSLHSIKDTGNDFFVPEGFSPNLDGVNDYLVIRKPANLTATLEVYNRWGGLIYRNDDYKNDWNGGLSSQNRIPAGTYFYVVRLSDGREFSKFLTINL